MYDLKFDPGICEKCTTLDCVMDCQYIDMNLEEAREERMKIVRGEDSKILHECVTCYACEEYCPRGNHPFYHIVETQEKLGINPVPRPITKSQVVAMAPGGKIKHREGSGPLVDLCFFPMLTGLIRGKLFKDASYFTGSDYMCQVMFLHFARDTVMKERIPPMIEKIHELYVKKRPDKELVCFHDECFGTYTSWAPAHGIPVPFKPVHLFDYLAGQLKAHKADIKKLNIKAAYQRPCSNRLIPETDKLVDEIFDLIGVERAGRKYDRKNALCCAAVMEAQQRFDRAEEVQERNVADMKASGASHVVFNCPMCYFTLSGKVSEQGMTPTLMSELCIKAVGE
jgi:Fe-S oxidoreductase